MRMIGLLSGLLFLFVSYSYSQNIGIGTTTPNAKAILEVRATDKGILFPALTTSQRNAISNPPNGLQIFNTDERCLNYYDSIYGIWNCYCSGCQTAIINITSNACKLDFYTTYGRVTPAVKYIVRIAPGVVISGCSSGDTALSFNNMPDGVSIALLNYGTIAGAGGGGGDGAVETGCAPSFGIATPGKTGGAAISTKAGVVITVNNYGIVAGGGGGGGGSTKNPSGVGGGGGGGAGMVGGAGGQGGGVYQSSGPPFNLCVLAMIGQPGIAGFATTGGAGGPGVSGGGNGGNGGLRGQAGQNGNGSFAATGGAGGKAITGGGGNVVVNISGGQSFGTVD